MNRVTSLVNKLYDINNADFKKYSMITMGIIMVLCLGIIWRYHTAVGALKKKISILNGIREEARGLQEAMIQVHNQRARVDEMLKEETDFKIAGYFNSVIDKLQLNDNKKTEETTQIDREDNYRESELIATMINMDMKQITELLYEFEQKKRIYSKKLILEKSKKNSSRLDITLIIATLLNKEVE